MSSSSSLDSERRATAMAVARSGLLQRHAQRAKALDVEEQFRLGRVDALNLVAANLPNVLADVPADVASKVETLLLGALNAALEDLDEVQQEREASSMVVTSTHARAQEPEAPPVEVVQ